jgi:uncharacterized protein YdhG (YjbR/CyaY superfamily)
VTPETIDAYLATVPGDQREALEHLRRQLHRLMPDAVEGISYGMPAFKVGGRAAVWFAAWKSHLSIYPLTEPFLAAHADDIRGYGQTKGALHFTPEAPLLEPLLAAFVRARIDDLEGDAG